MPSCECCWNMRPIHLPPDEGYARTLKEHEAIQCVCTKNTLEGARARAGQFWDETTQKDTRDKP